MLLVVAIIRTMIFFIDRASCTDTREKVASKMCTFDGQIPLGVLDSSDQIYLNGLLYLFKYSRVDV